MNDYKIKNILESLKEEVENREGIPAGSCCRTS